MPFATHILVPTDFSNASELALEAAATIAQRGGVKITLVHVHDADALRTPVSFTFAPQPRETDLAASIDGAILAALDKARRDRLADVANVDTAVLHETGVAHAICTYAEKVGADLIVQSTHGRTGLKHLLIGSVAERVIRHASCAVLTLRSKTVD